MSENPNQANDIKMRLILFFRNNKIKILISFFIIFFGLISYSLNQYNIKKTRNLISEKYILAGIYLSSGEKEKSKKLFEEIVLSNDKFYTSLALYSILEKKLENDRQKILMYFDNAKKSVKLKDQKDIITFKKALYLLKENETDKAKSLLKNLIKSDSKIKSLAEEILTK